MITLVQIDNFKSLKRVSVDLPALSYFCGPNASGKSNFAEALDFLGNAFRSGLSYAVSEKGGFYNICFRRQRRARGAISFLVRGSVNPDALLGGEATYEICFSLRTKEEAIRSDYFVGEERYAFSLQEPEYPPLLIQIAREGDRYNFRLDKPERVSPKLKDFMPWIGSADQLFAEFLRPRPKELLYPLAVEGLFPFHPMMFDVGGTRVFRISARIARQAGTPSVSGELGKQGENLPSALDHMRATDRAAFDRLQEWVREVVPGLSHLETDYTETKQLGLFLQERGFGRSWYAEDLSDGTLMAISLFLSLLEQRNRVVVVEEPENSLHPWALRKFLSWCREISSEKQLLLTTQSPLVVASAEPENLFVVERDRGVTQITPALVKEPTLAQVTREKFLDLGEYWLSGGVGAVPGPPGAEDGTADSDEEG